MKYTVKKGEHDFKPNPLPSLHFSREIEKIIVFDESCWWDKENPDYFGGNDIYDWNKAFGLTSAFSLNNSYSVMIGWRPSKKKNIMEVTWYINHKDRSFDSGGLEYIEEVEVGEPIKCSIKWRRGLGAWFYYGTKRYADINFKRPWFVRQVSAWFGGNQRAHKDMSLSMV